MKKSFLVIGGDIRQIALANMLSSAGKIVNTYGFSDDDILKKSDFYIFGMPFFRDGILNAPLSTKTLDIDEIMKFIDCDSVIFAGYIPADFYKKYPNHKIIDYLMREELEIENAIITAEGAIELAMREMDIMLHGQKVLIIGNGRIGKILSNKMAGLSCDVTVSARKFCDFADIKARGLKSINTNFLEKNLQEFDLIINTVPFMILDSEKIININKKTLVICLASKPGGIDFEFCKKSGIKALQALALPGKVAPISAAKIIYDTINNILREGDYNA